MCFAANTADLFVDCRSVKHVPEATRFIWIILQWYYKVEIQIFRRSVLDKFLFN